MLEKLWANDESNFKYWNNILKNKLLTRYLTIVNSKNESLAAAVSALEAENAISNRQKRYVVISYYHLAYLLSGQRILHVGDKNLKNATELAAYMRELFDSSYQEFERFCQQMLDGNNMLDAQLEAWLIALGKREELDSWRRQLS